MALDMRTFREVSEVIGSMHDEIKRINEYDEDLSVSDATQILSEFEDRLVDIIYRSARREEITIIRDP